MSHDHHTRYWTSSFLTTDLELSSDTEWINSRFPELMKWRTTVATICAVLQDSPKAWSDMTVLRACLQYSSILKRWLEYHMTGVIFARIPAYACVRIIEVVLRIRCRTDGYGFIRQWSDVLLRERGSKGWLPFLRYLADAKQAFGTRPAKVKSSSCWATSPNYIRLPHLHFCFSMTVNMHWFTFITASKLSLCHGQYYSTIYSPLCV